MNRFCNQRPASGFLAQPTASRRATFSAGSGRRRASMQTRVAASYGVEPAGSSRSILEAFYYGKAFAETLNEKLGAALDDLLSDLGKQDAERRESMRQFQEEVEERARRDLQEAGTQTSSPVTAGSGGGAAAPMTYRAGNSFMAGSGPAAASSASGRPTISGNGRQAVIATPPDLQETVDELRAEMASTRAAIKLYKERRQLQQQQSNGPVQP